MTDNPSELVPADASNNGDDQSEPEESDNEAEPDESEELGSVQISDEDKDAFELDFHHCKIPKIENLEVLTQIETLGFRWNFIKKIENLQTLTTLQELELNHNKLRKIEGLETLTNL